MAKIPCDICGKYYLKYGLNRHKTKIECEKCQRRFNPSYFPQHKCFRTEEPPKEVCNICGKTLGKGSLAKHIKTVHGEIERKECHICGKSLRGSDCLKAHMKVHEEKQCCPECGMKVRNIRTHIMNVHMTDEQKKYKCQECGKGFIDTQRLEAHKMSVHLKTYPYKCRYGCDAKYNDSSNRNCHERKKHGAVFKEIITNL